MMLLSVATTHLESWDEGETSWADLLQRAKQNRWRVCNTTPSHPPRATEHHVVAK